MSATNPLPEAERAAARAAALVSASVDDSEALMRDARESVVETVFASGEYFTIEPLAVEMAGYGTRGSVVSPGHAGAIAFGFDASSRLRTSFGDTRFFAHAPEFVDELRVRSSRNPRVAVGASYQRDSQSRIVASATCNKTGARTWSVFRWSDEGALLAVTRHSSEWAVPQHYDIEGGPGGQLAIRLRETGKIVYSSKPERLSELLRRASALVRRDIRAQLAARLGKHRALGLAIAFNSTSSAETVPPWTVMCTEERARRLPRDMVFSPLAFAHDGEPLEIALAHDTRETCDRARLSIRSPEDVAEVESTYVRVARELNADRAWLAAIADRVLSAFVVYAVDVERGSFSKDLVRCATKEQLQALEREGWLAHQGRSS